MISLRTFVAIVIFIFIFIFVFVFVFVVTPLSSLASANDGSSRLDVAVLCAKISKLESTVTCEVRKSHFERYQFFYAAMLGLFSATVVYLFQQNFSRWWLARNGWQRIDALMLSYLEHLQRHVATANRALLSPDLDLAWVIKVAVDTGVDSTKLTKLLHLVREIRDIENGGTESSTISDLQVHLAKLRNTWKSPAS
jgi:hypothetical protein